MNYNQITNFDVNNGPGFRISFWTQGCNIRCPGCFNSELWDFKKGKPFTNFTIKRILVLCRNPNVTGLTILGGEPMDNWQGILKLLFVFRRYFKRTKTVWLYTGYNIEKFYKFDGDYIIPPIYKVLFSLIDVIVDGPYIAEKRDTSLQFRGSTNQRLIDIKKSLQQNKIVLYET